MRGSSDSQIRVSCPFCKTKGRGKTRRATEQPEDHDQDDAGVGGSQEGKQGELIDGRYELIHV